MPELRLTHDGSYTLFDDASGECYHSYKGALAESEHVFIAGSDLQEKLQSAHANNQPLCIVEMGLGTGLNYLLAARAAMQSGVQLHYHAIENNLVHSRHLECLQFDQIPGLDALSQEYLQLPFHDQQLPQGQHSVNTSTGTLRLHLGDARSCELPADHFDVCFFDAFSPSSAPELWQKTQLSKFYNSLKTGGAWVSYCASGAVRRDLISCGFSVQKLPGPLGKREMLRATRPSLAPTLPNALTNP